MSHEILLYRQAIMIHSNKAFYKFLGFFLLHFNHLKFAHSTRVECNCWINCVRYLSVHRRIAKMAQYNQHDEDLAFGFVIIGFKTFGV